MTNYTAKKIKLGLKAFTKITRKTTNFSKKLKQKTGYKLLHIHSIYDFLVSLARTYCSLGALFLYCSTSLYFQTSARHFDGGWNWWIYNFTWNGG